MRNERCLSRSKAARVIPGKGDYAMAVLSVTTLQIKPGSYEAFLDTQRRAKAILERCGAKNYRVAAALSAGEASGSVVATWEADDFAAQGAVTDRFLADADGLALFMEVNTTEGPTAGWQSSIWVDVPL